MDRRAFLESAGATFSAAAVAGLPRAAAAQSAPIRIGMMAPLSGVVAAGGREMVDGFKMYWEGVGYEVAGRKIEVSVEDDAGNPDTALQKARRLVEQTKVDFLFGNLLANTGLAVANYVKTNGVPYFIPIIAANELTQRDRIPNVIRVAGYAASQFPMPLADWAKKQGHRKMATIAQDYSFGHEQCGGFCQVFTDGGGRIVQQFWNPLNTSDFSPYLGQIAALDIDGLFIMELGSDANRFMQQFANFGLKGRIPMLSAMNFTDQSVIRTAGPECEGIVSSAHFAEGADNPATQKFVAAYQKKFGILPSLYGFAMYSGAMWVADAIAKIDGAVEKRPEFLEAVRTTVLTDSPLGRPVRLDDYGNPIYDVYIRKVVKNKEGKYWNTPIEIYKNVSQFWTYDPQAYMKQPTFSRNFQGIKQS
ncbi:MAG: ABC transporter substrate-binding protein [Burkholderiaceae bacterium]|nr:ABC transporter substrate-binding protein [Burkholderiaceae bacterium]